MNKGTGPVAPPTSLPASDNLSFCDSGKSSLFFIQIKLFFFFFSNWLWLSTEGKETMPCDLGRDHHTSCIKGNDTDFIRVIQKQAVSQATAEQF